MQIFSGKDEERNDKIKKDTFTIYWFIEKVLV